MKPDDQAGLTGHESGRADRRLRDDRAGRQVTLGLEIFGGGEGAQDLRVRDLLVPESPLFAPRILQPQFSTAHGGPSSFLGYLLWFGPRSALLAAPRPGLGPGAGGLGGGGGADPAAFLACAELHDPVAEGGGP